MVKLCLMASHGYPLGNGLVFVPEQTRVLKDSQPYFPCQGARHEIKRPNSLSVEPCQHEPWRPVNGFCDRTQFARIDSPVGRPVLIDVQDTCPDSVLFSFGIAEQCTKHEKILKFLTSGSSELEKSGLDLSLLSDLMDLQALVLDVHQQPCSPLIYPNGSCDAPKPLVDFVGDLASSSKITVHPDGRVLLTGSGTEMKDILSIVAEFYLSKTSTTWTKQSMLVPRFAWPHISETQANVLNSSLNVKDVTAPLRSSEKIKLKPSPKKKSCRKGNKERDLYQRNYFHACESLLSLMMDKKRHGKTAILSLKKSGPELPSLLTQFSAGIAGTGLAVLFSVVCKVACGRMPFCTAKLFSTGFGFGLVWLSWAVNRLRDTIIYISKNASKLGLKDEEMLRIVDRSLKDVYFRAATLMVVAALRLA
ncbi:uncharacterized protein LOC8285869 isoform X2 [Ricinus communis]|uniref:Uncharacterized protein n=1 Tax=Ricinus communis TaxID=3988 RepID=B9SFP1_RICCO|nr:uncharacterized protein LOC8285869 isoform X2 [Ricinus communis]EEF37653.1 conserved hypothetical protein [Ricinus communis]|eukprot:XP_002524810.1 uncharacterized protein LOC8285869 [Ricinus communis]